jgi:DnaJ domain
MDDSWGKKEASHYDVLGVSETADLKVIKDAYHKASLKLHPDKQKNNTIQTEQEGSDNHDDYSFERVKTAWECLRDQDSRRCYDQERTIHLQSLKGRKASAIILSTADCHPFTIHINNSNNDDVETGGTVGVGTGSGDTSTSTTSIVVLAYTCRCGMILDTTNPPPPPHEDDNNEEEEEEYEYDDDDGLMDCPGCSLVYDTSRVGE